MKAISRHIVITILVILSILSLFPSVKGAPLSVLIIANPNYVTLSTGNGVSFESKVSGGTAPYFYEWNFGDFGTDSVATPNHVFNYAGVFNVSLYVTDSTVPVNSFLVYTTVTVVASNATANFFNVSGLPGSISVIGWLLGLLAVALFVFGAWKFPLAIFISGLVAVFLGLQLYSETHSLVISGFMWLFAILIVFFGVFRVYSEYSPGE